jgi:hypothetical protein
MLVLSLIINLLCTAWLSLFFATGFYFLYSGLTNKPVQQAVKFPFGLSWRITLIPPCDEHKGGLIEFGFFRDKKKAEKKEN